MDDRIVAKRKEDVPNRRDERPVVCAGQIGPSDRTGKQRVADEELLADCAFLSHLQAYPARTVTRRVMRPHPYVPNAMTWFGV